MILTGGEIRRQNGRNLEIFPFEESRINPNSYNLCLGKYLLTYNDEVLDMKKDNPYSIMEIPEEGLVLEPNKLYLGQTVEHTKTSTYVPMLEGRSSIGRLGLHVHVTAGFGDIGFEGYWTLELHCIQPIRIYAGVEVCQIYYHTLEGDASRKYKDGKYSNNNGVQPSLLWKDYEGVNK